MAPSYPTFEGVPTAEVDQLLGAELTSEAGWTRDLVLGLAVGAVLGMQLAILLVLLFGR